MSTLPVGSSASSTRRLDEQRPGDGGALLLAAGELRRLLVLVLAHADELEDLGELGLA